MDNNNESTSTSVEINNNAWKLVTPSRDDIDTLSSLLEDYNDADIDQAKSDFECAFEEAQSTYNEVVEEANDKLREIKQLIEGSDWGKSLINYEYEERNDRNPTLHKLLNGLTGIDDFLCDVNRHDECLEIHNGHEDNSDGISSVIEDLEALEGFQRHLVKRAPQYASAI